MSHFYNSHRSLIPACLALAAVAWSTSGSTAYAQTYGSSGRAVYGVTQRTPEQQPTPVRVPGAVGASISAATLGPPTPIPSLPPSAGVGVVPSTSVAPTAGRLPPPTMAQAAPTYPATPVYPTTPTYPPVTAAPTYTPPPAATYPSTTYPNAGAPLALPPPPAATPGVPTTPQPTLLGPYPYQTPPTPVRPELPSASFVRPLEQSAPGVTFNRATTFAAPNPYAVPAVNTGGGTYTPTTYQPIATDSPIPRDYYLGRGMFGGPKVYVQGQPVRNGLRFVFP